MLAHERLVVFDADVSTSASSAVPALPDTSATLRVSPRSFARSMADVLNAVENSFCIIASTSRTSVRASLPASTARRLSQLSVVAVPMVDVRHVGVGVN